MCFRERHMMTYVVLCILMQHDAALPCLYPLYLIWKPQMIRVHLRLVLHVRTYTGFL